MLIKINSALNEQKNELPTNIVSEALNQKLELMDIQDNLKLILLGDLNVVFLKDILIINLLIMIYYKLIPIGK